MPTLIGRRRTRLIKTDLVFSFVLTASKGQLILVSKTATFVDRLTAAKGQITLAGKAITTVPVSVVAPVVSGTTTVGSVLSCTTGTWTNSPTSYTYQWYRAVTSGGVPITDGNGNYVGVAISGATASTYALVTGDLGEFIFCDVLASNASGPALLVKSSNYVGLITAGGYSAEAQQFFDRITDPGTTRKGHYATLIDGLVADGIWSKLDALYILAADIAGNAVVNLKSSSYGLTLVNSPTFTADQGYAGNGSSSYINTNFVPSTAGGNFTQDSASFGVYTRTARTSAATYANIGTQHVGAFHHSSLWPWYTGNLLYAGANSQFLSVTATAVSGMWVVSRTGSAGFDLRRNGSLFNSFIVVSQGLSSNSFLIGATREGGAGNPTDFSTDQNAAAFIGGGLTTAEDDNLASGINAFGTSVGWNIY